MTKTGDISAAQNPYETGMVGTLRRVVAVLNEARVPYWIDCGTLLGLIRDQKIIPWDEDVELGAWLTDKPLFDARTPDFLTQGLVVTVDKPDKLGLQLDDGAPYTFRVQFYELSNGVATRGGMVGTSLLGRTMRFMANVLRDARGTTVGSGGEGSTRDGLVRLVRALPHSVSGLARRMLEALPVRTRARYEIPERFFRERRTVPFYDLNVAIPAEAANYLAFRFGVRWTQPTRYWVDRAGASNFTRHK